MKKVNPLMTVWLISSVITYSSLIEANSPSFKHEKRNHGLSELSRLHDSEHSLASFKIDYLRLINAVKKKKKEVSSSSNESQSTTKQYDRCEVSKTTKSKKGGKKQKTTQSSQQKSSEETTSNKWKRIQNFFFGPPNWSNKGDRGNEVTTTEARCSEKSKQSQVYLHPKDDETTVVIQTYLHPIPNDKNDQYKGRTYLEGGIILTNKPDVGNSKQQMDFLCKKETDEITKTPPKKFYQDGMLSNQSISQDGKLIPTQQEDGCNRTSSLEQMDKTEERTKSMLLNEQERILARPWYMTQEEVTFRKQLPELDKVSEGGKLPYYKQLNESNNEQTNIPEKRLPYGKIFEYINIPTSNHKNFKEYFTLNDKEILYSEPSQTPSTIGINEAIEEGQLNLKHEEITDNVKGNYEVSMVREDSKQSYKPEEALIEQPPNQTIMLKPDLLYKNDGMTADKWKHIFNSHDCRPLKDLYSDFVSHHATENYLTNSHVENALTKILNSNFYNRYNNEFDNNIIDDSKRFLKAISNFFKKGNSEIFTHSTIEKQCQTSLPPLLVTEKDNSNLSRAKQYLSLKTEAELPIEQSKNTFSNAWESVEYHTPNLDSLLNFGKPTIRYVTEETNKVSKQQKLSETPSKYSSLPTTIVKQYNIDMWPKWTEKADYSTDYFNNVSTQSSVDLVTYTPLTEVFSSSKYQNEPNLTMTVDSSSCSSNTKKKWFNSNGSTESIKEHTLTKENATFANLVTIPLIYTERSLKMINYLSTTEVTQPKPLEHQSDFNLSLQHMLLNNLWGIQPNLKSTSPRSTPLEDDKIAFDSLHEFNVDHDLKSTTSQPFLSNITNWAPYNIPFMGNEYDIVSPGTLKKNELTEENTKEIQNFTKSNEHLPGFLKKSQMSMFANDMKKDIMMGSKYIPLYETNRRNSYFFNHPFEKPELVEILPDYSGYQNKSLNDSILNEIKYKAGKKNEKIVPYTTSSTQSEKKNYNKIPYNSRKQSYFEELTPADYQMIKGTVNSKGRYDLAQSLVDPLLRNLKMLDLMKLEVSKNVIDETTTPLMDNHMEINNKINFGSNLNKVLSSEPIEFDGLTSKYEEINTKGDELLIQQSNRSFVNYDKSPVLLSDKYIHNDQNEKYLASEMSLNKQLSISSSEPNNFQKEMNIDSMKNNIGVLKNIMNQSLPEFINNRDSNKNEFLIQMSAIKIIKKRPEKFVAPHYKNYISTPLYDPLKNILSKSNSNMEIRPELSRIFSKMQDFINKQNIKKFIQKRDTIYSRKNLFETNKSRRNEYSVLPTSITQAVPFDISVTHNAVKMLPSTFNNNIQCNNIISNIKHYKMFDKWKSNMQSLIDKRNEKRNLHFNIYDDAVQEDSEKLLSYVINNNLKHLGIRQKPLEKFLGKQIHQHIMNSDNNCQNNVEQFFTNDNNKIVKRNVLTNKKMKSRELEFILDRNLPMLPLNKRQFIAYMMTGLKNSGNSILADDERHSQLSKSNLQLLIDRNVKKDKMVELINKRPKKKHWHTVPFL